MTSLTFDRFCNEIIAQTDLLTAHVRGADMTAAVPTCPGWNIGQLLRHVGGDHRWAENVVRTRATAPVSDALANDLAAYTREDGTVLAPWLTEGAGRLSTALRAAGPGTPLWTPAEDRSTALFWARRMTHETVVHRADAALTTGTPFTIDRDLAVDAVEEWLDFSTVSEAYEPHPGLPDLLGPDSILRFHATDAGAWHVDLTGDRPAWRTEAEQADEASVTVRGPARDLLLLLYRRPAPAVDIRGDKDLLDLWLNRTGFWLQ
jgi:uncharacterized protein (TIGR03083 family)